MAYLHGSLDMWLRQTWGLKDRMAGGQGGGGRTGISLSFSPLHHYITADAGKPVARHVGDARGSK